MEQLETVALNVISDQSLGLWFVALEKSCPSSQILVAVSVTESRKIYFAFMQTCHKCKP